MSEKTTSNEHPGALDGYQFLACIDSLDCQCVECEKARVVNLRTTLIRCILEGEMNQAMQAEVIAAITHSYGSDRWLRVWGIDG